MLCIYVYAYIYISLSIYTYIYIYIYAYHICLGCGRFPYQDWISEGLTQAEAESSGGGILSIGNFPESLSQHIL